ncbi:MAG: replication factor C small subunit [Candidatus Aenigmatarchaeota archaeon]
MALEEIWTEKYRPKKFSEIIGQEEVVKRLEAFVRNNTLPHCLFAGPAGVGKTTTALVIAHELFGENWHQNFLELNASDERGIDTIRTKVKDFARTVPLGYGFKIIYLDEADALTRDAQQALRRMMEKFAGITRFILACNYVSKIIIPIQSRTAIFKFKPISEKAMRKFLEKIAKNEKLKVDDESYSVIYHISEGDMRRAINILQTAAQIKTTITPDVIYSVSSNPNPEEVKKMLELALNKKFEEARKILISLIREEGLSGEDIMKEIHNQIINLKVDDEKKARILAMAGDYEFRISEGCNPRIQLESFLAQLIIL